MQHNGHPRQQLADLLQAVEVELGFALELVRAVAGADGDGQRIAAGAGDEVLGLLGVGVDVLVGTHVLLHTGQAAQLGLDPHAAGVGVFHHALGLGDVFLVGQVRAVVHNGGEAAVDDVFAELKIGAVVQVQHHGQVGHFKGRLHELDDVILPGVLARTGGDLQDERGVFRHARLHDALDDLHIIHVERADGVAAGIGFCEHFLG